MKPYRWATAGDVNAFFGLMLDNVANLVLTIGLLAGGFGFPASFAVRYMLPGTALGVMVGDLAFAWLAYGLAAALLFMWGQVRVSAGIDEREAPVAH